MSNKFEEDLRRLENLARESYDVMANYVSHLDCVQSLVELKRFIKSRRRQKKHIFEFRGSHMGFHIFPFLFDLILKHAASHPLVRRQMSENDIAWLFDHYVQYPEALQFSGGKSDLDKYAPEFIIRSSFEQLTFQEGNRTFLPRIVLLYKQIPESNRQRHARFISTRDQILHNQFRVTFDELLLCAFALSAIADSADRFGTTVKTDIEWMRPYLESDALPIVRGQLTLTRDAYRRKAAGAFSGEYALTKNEPKVISEWPIVEIGGYFIAPDPHLLPNRVTRMLHDSMYQFCVDNKRVHDYSGTFGEVFKDYIGLLLGQCFPEAAIIDVDGDNFQHLGRKADWVVLQDDCAAVFECKALRYPKELKSEGSLTTLASFLLDRIEPALNQLGGTIKMLPQITEQLGHRQVSRIFSIIVLEEHFEFINAVRDFLPNDAVVSEIVASGTQIFSALDLEILASCSVVGSFEEAIVSKCHGDHVLWSLDRHLRSVAGFHFVEDNLLERKFREFFHMGEP